MEGAQRRGGIVSRWWCMVLCARSGMIADSVRATRRGQRYAPSPLRAPVGRADASIVASSSRAGRVGGVALDKHEREYKRG